MKFFRPLIAILSFAALSPANGALEPEAQKESDWVDARWNATDLGNFHASLLELPNGVVAKGLSIRVGEQGEAAMVYDTATASLRGGWTNGFLKFNSTRYGLLRTPKPGGDVQFVCSAVSAWGDARVHWTGLHVHGPRVALEYEVAQAKVLESPWWEHTGRIAAFTCTIEVKSEKDLLLKLFEEKAIALTNIAGVDVATVRLKPHPLSLAVIGDARFRVERGVLTLRLLPAKATSRAKLFFSMADAPALASLVKQSAPPDDLSLLTKPGAPRWTPLTTRGQRGFGSEAFVIDTLTIPYQNPWKALFFTSGVDFLPNGDAAVCTIHGDVWLVSGIDEKLEKLTWRRFATGLLQPLGLRVRDGNIFVLGRDQITVLHDENGDGEADFYKNFFNGIHTLTGHDYVTSLDADTNGNFYFIDPSGVHRVLRDGSHDELIASGLRNPNGMGVSADGGIVLAAPQQGEWTPSSAIVEARAGGWYGYGGPRPTAERPVGYDAPLCWIPHSVDNSGGSELWVKSDRWEPLRDHFIHFSYGRCSEFLVLREVVDGVAQGAVTPLPGKFLSGAMRGAFNPRDGQLYVVGSTGWQTAAARDGCLQRVRFTGANPLLPIDLHIHTNGIRLSFTTPLDRPAAEDTGSYSVSHWNYRYAKSYGSKDYSPGDAAKEGHDVLAVKSAKLLGDGKTIFLEVPGLKPVMQFELKYSLNSAEGKPMRSSVWGTVNRLGPKF